mgnify:CR=1 FL=1
MCFRDMSFCTLSDECARASECRRAYTPEVKAAAAKWWGEGFGPVPVLLMAFTHCFEPLENKNETDTSRDGSSVQSEEHT